MMKSIFFTLFLFPMMMNAQSTLSEANYRIYSVRDAKEVSLDAIVDAMANFDVLFFGEEHNDSVTHFLQKKVFEKLHVRFGSKLVLSMEMFDRDVQYIMDEYLAGLIRERNFVKEARSWSNYKDYRPLVELAKEKGLYVICANAPTRYTNLAGREGQDALKKLSRRAKESFAPVPYPIATGDYLAKLKGVMHTPSVPVTDSASAKRPTPPPVAALPNFNMVVSQSLWDATMAYSIYQYQKKKKGEKVLHLNGRFHSDEGFGAVAQLKTYNPKLRPLIISSSSDKDFPVVNWEKHRKNGDFIIITDPAVPRSY
jgi:uncharacterized iron-regulated protein